jgi:uncharacterized protein (TIRG00374 family)
MVGRANESQNIREYTMKDMKWKLLLGMIISAVFLYFAFRSVDPDELVSAFRTADYRYVIPAVALSLISIWFRAVRWRYLLNPVKKISLLSLFSATSIGFLANTVLPARLGEFIRAYVIGKKENISKSSAFATVVVARIFDGMTVLLFFAITLIRFSQSYPDWLRNVAYIAFAFYLCALVFVITLRLRTDQATRFAAFVLKPFPARIADQATRLMNSFIDGLGIIRDFRSVIMASLYSILVWLPTATIIYILVRSFGIEIPLYGAFLMLVIFVFGTMIPSAPAFVGTIQFCSVAGLSIFNVSQADALSFSVIFHLVSFLPITIVGFIFLFKEGYSLMELQTSAKDDAGK